MSLLSGLAAYWSLNEASGIRFSHNGLNNLTDNNTVTGNPGVVGMASQLTFANSEYLSIADNPDVSIGNDAFTFAGWLYFDGGADDRVVIAQGYGASSASILFRYRQSLNKFQLNVYDSSGAVKTINWSGAVSTSVWHFFVLRHDRANNLLSLKIDSAAEETVSTAGFTVYDSSGVFYIGVIYTSILSDYWNGRLNSIGHWKRALSHREITKLYNNKMGLAYPFDNYSRRLRHNRLVGNMSNTEQPSAARG